MYNGVGVQTARGTGTNGYVQANLSHVMLSRKRIDYNADADLAKNEAMLTKKPDEAMIEHSRKRAVEVKCTEFEMLMESKGFEPEEIEKKVGDYRKVLLSQLANGELNVDDELDAKNSHVKQLNAMGERDRFRSAFGIKEDYVPGSSMQNMNPTLPDLNAVVETDDKKALLELKAKKKADKKLRKKLKKEKKKQKKREKKEKAARKEREAQKEKDKSKKRRKDSSSDSSSASDSESSSSSSSDSDDERRRRKRKEARRPEKEVKKEVDSDDEGTRRRNR
ncbi:unnamed protein product, partial [Mesorhabditis spiculigera]